MAKSKFLKFKSTKLSDYLKLKTNRVLSIDDISSNFSNSEDQKDNFGNIKIIDPNNEFNRFLVQVTDSTDNFYQLTEIIALNDDSNIFNLIKSSITPDGNDEESTFSRIEGTIDEFDNMYLKFQPDNYYDYDYNIKVLSNSFITKSTQTNSISVGFVDIFSYSNLSVVDSVTNFITLDKNQYSSVFVGINLIGQSSNYKNYVELHLIHDGENVHFNELYFDDVDGFNSRPIGSFTSYILDNELKIDYINNSDENIHIRTRNIGFGSTSVGIGTYRFLSDGQPEGTETTAIYDTNFSNGVGSSPLEIFSMEKGIFTSCKSLVKVSIGETSSLYELMMIHNGTNININEYPFLSVGSTSGIGTFGAIYSGQNLVVNFYPESSITGDIEVLSFNEKIYKDIDQNTPNPLVYSPTSDSLTYSIFYGKNSNKIDVKEFELFSNGNPIFLKKFNPVNNFTLNKETGVFTINDHLFSNLERIIYRPKSTFVGVGESPMGIGATLNSSGIVTDFLPEDLYVIKISPNQFKLSTRKDYAQVGIHVTFTSIGEGNSHELEMYEKNSKVIVAVDEIIQYPLLYTDLEYELSNNGGEIGTGSSIFSLSGISSIFPKDLLKIENEYVYVTNVGVGTSILGPIGFAGTIPLVEVERGSVGSISTSHLDGTSVRLYRGSYNIVGNKLYFTNPPRGSAYSFGNLDLSNLEKNKSTFNGRVFLRSDYSSNIIYDDISYKFTGLDSDYAITTSGINTVGLGTNGGNGILILNGIFQTPLSENQTNNNFKIIENESLGITTVSFTGITSSNGEIIVSPYDINSNQLPRGGVIVSLGSTNGLGYAPLAGASVTAIVSGGSIVGITTSNEFGSFGSGYREPVSISIGETSGYSGTPADIEVVVGSGGTLAFNIISGGSGYTSPEIIISPPSYENLPVVGVSRLGIGETTETGSNLLVSVEVGASSTSGIGSTTFSVTNYKISRNGYGFKKGDVFKVVGLVTAKDFSEPIEEFQLTVLETFNDSFALWNFGELNYIDSIKQYQDGNRLRFPLYYNSQLLTFEKDADDEDSQLIDTNNLLLIFINGILQVPGESYQFDGGSSFTFSEPPKPEDNISIFFYVGSTNIDSELVNITETIKIGDQIKVLSSNEPELFGITFEQESRYITDIKTSDTIETSIYTGKGIDDINYRPSEWIKQKRDLIINNDIVSKVRDSLEPQIYPTSKIIKSFNLNENEIFVEDISLFKYDNADINNFDFILLDENKNYIPASVTSTVSVGGTIEGLSITNPGNGYIGSTVDIKISNPPKIGVGIGTTASATATIVNGQISSPIIITNPGFGYSTLNPPQTIIESPPINIKKFIDADSIEGFTLKVVSISTTTGISTDLALSFTFEPSPLLPQLKVGYPIYISNTSVGVGITSIDFNDTDIVGVGTISIDNIYYVHSYDSVLGIATCNISSKTTISGINTSTSNINYPVGKASWGRISGFIPENIGNIIDFDVTGYEVSGLSTFPTIQRRGYGLRSNGSIKKLLS